MKTVNARIKTDEPRDRYAAVSFNEPVQRTGASRLVQIQIERQGRLVPAADLVVRQQ